MSGEREKDENDTEEVIGREHAGEAVSRREKPNREGVKQTGRKNTNGRRGRKSKKMTRGYMHKEIHSQGDSLGC